MTSGISKSVSNGTLAEITTVANKYTNSFFLNVVEEPAQNLFTESQMKNLAFLLEAANVNDENKIVMTSLQCTMFNLFILLDICLFWEIQFVSLT